MFFLAELGDYTKDEHSINSITEFRLLPDDKQTEEFEEQVLSKWMTYKYLNISFFLLLNNFSL